MDIKIPCKSTTQWTPPDTQDTAPQDPDQLCARSAQTFGASLLFSPYGSCQRTCALADKAHRPPAFNSKVFPPRHFHFFIKSVLGPVLGTKNANHTAQSNQNTTYKGRDRPMATSNPFSWAFRNPSAPRLVGGTLMSALPTMSWGTL